MTRGTYLAEETGVVSTEIEVASEANSHPGVDVPVRAARKTTKVVRQHGRVHLAEPAPLEAAVQEPGNDRQEQPDHDPHRHDEVRTTRPVDLLAQCAPEHRVRVECLHLLTGPRTRALAREQDRALITHHALHDHIVQERADARPDDLHGERDARRQFRVLAQLEVRKHDCGLPERGTRIELEVHVRLRGTGDDGRAEHLEQLRHVRYETEAGGRYVNYSHGGRQ
jgi:hypothetical protein